MEPLQDNSVIETIIRKILYLQLCPVHEVHCEEHRAFYAHLSAVVHLMGIRKLYKHGQGRI